MVKYQGHIFRNKMDVAGALVFHKHSLFLRWFNNYSLFTILGLNLDFTFYVDSIDQDQTAQKVQSGLNSTLMLCQVFRQKRLTLTKNKILHLSISKALCSFYKLVNGCLQERRKHCGKRRNCW